MEPLSLPDLGDLPLDLVTEYLSGADLLAVESTCRRWRELCAGAWRRLAQHGPVEDDNALLLSNKQRAIVYSRSLETANQLSKMYAHHDSNCPGCNGYPDLDPTPLSQPSNYWFFTAIGDATKPCFVSVQSCGEAWVELQWPTHKNNVTSLSSTTLVVLALAKQRPCSAQVVLLTDSSSHGWRLQRCRSHIAGLLTAKDLTMVQASLAQNDKLLRLQTWGALT